MNAFPEDGWILPGAARLEAGEGGLSRIVVATPRTEGQIYLHGAHIGYHRPLEGPSRAPTLFMSRSSWFEEGKPIRGGIPVVFPWFGRRADDPTAPQHGFARLRSWTLRSAECRPDGTVAVVLGLESDPATRALWPHDFALELRAEFGVALSVELAVTNRGAAPFVFEEALHTYLAVADARRVVVEGFGGPYVDTSGGARTARKSPAGPIRLAGETDRIYSGHRARVTVRDPEGKRALVVEREGSDSAVLWNPWIAKAKAMPDFGDDEWPLMLCVEAGNVADCAVTLAPGATHRLRTRIFAE
ncbi:MAG: D-hexose-6-phosphate mutarotase [Verrucomicrobiae bacterium]|nr:D-hexose-6-phosphate mutarotase [Verrucomicrobiae bacterium]